MPDISMCMKKECPKFNKCYRAMAKPDKGWQSYSEFQDCNEETGYQYHINLYPNADKETAEDEYDGLLDI